MALVGFDDLELAVLGRRVKGAAPECRVRIDPVVQQLLHNLGHIVVYGGHQTPRLRGAGGRQHDEHVGQHGCCDRGHERGHAGRSRHGKIGGRLLSVR